MSRLIMVFMSLVLISSVSSCWWWGKSEHAKELERIKNETELEIAIIESEREREKEKRKSRPTWISKRPYIADPDIIEGVGVSDPKPSIEVMRGNSMDGVIAEISASQEVSDTAYTENYLKDFEEHYSSLGKTRGSRERLQLLIRKNILKQITFAEEWEDPETGQYWRYGFMPAKGADIATLEAAKDQVIEEEGLIIEVMKQEFLQKLDARLGKLQQEKDRQLEILQNKIEALKDKE